MKKLLLLICIILISVSCKKDESAKQINLNDYEGMISILEKSGDYSLFIQALEMTKMYEGFYMKEFTVFAPNDRAIIDMLTSEGKSKLDQLDEKRLKNIVQCSFIEGKVDLNKGDYYTSAMPSEEPGQNIHLYIKGNGNLKSTGKIMGNVILGKLHASLPFDIFKTDGIIKAPSIYDQIKHNPDLSIYITAIDELEMFLDLQDIYKNTSPITVIAWEAQIFNNFGVNTADDLFNLDLTTAYYLTETFITCASVQKRFLVNKLNEGKKLKMLSSYETILMKDVDGLDPGYVFLDTNDLNDDDEQDEPSINIRPNKMNIIATNGVLHTTKSVMVNLN